MPLTRELIKEKIKAKIEALRNEETDVNSEEWFAEMLLILLDELLTNATVTGLCPANGALTNGKIT